MMIQDFVSKCPPKYKVNERVYYQNSLGDILGPCIIMDIKPLFGFIPVYTYKLLSKRCNGTGTIYKKEKELYPEEETTKQLHDLEIARSQSGI